LGHGPDAGRRSGAAVVSRLTRAAPGRWWWLYGLTVRKGDWFRATLRCAHHRPKEDFDLHFTQILILKLGDLVEPLLTNGPLGLLKRFVLTLDDCSSHRAFAFFIALNARFEGRVKKYQCARDLVLPRQFE